MSRERIGILAALFALALSGCGNSSETYELLSGEYVERWGGAKIPEQGEVSVSEDGVLRMDVGRPLTGAVFREGDGFELPASRYKVEFEARRVEGGDFFAALTFPVREKDSCATLVLGGWGGSLIGISCLDERDASENFTMGSIPFENGRWYRFTVRVMDDEIKVWMNDSIIIDAPIAGKKISLRPGDIENCAPFGFASYMTEGEVRNLTLTRFGR